MTGNPPGPLQAAARDPVAAACPASSHRPTAAAPGAGGARRCATRARGATRGACGARGVSGGVDRCELGRW